MIKRIVEIGNPARLSYRNRQMVIEREGFDTATVPVEDLGVLILDHPAISHTQALLAACAENNVAVLVCDGRHHPGAVLVPLEGHSLHSRTIASQVQVSESTRKRLWQTIIRAKIDEQAKVLHSVTGEPHPLAHYARKVRSGDPDNIEAQAARIYWQRLFGPEFRRNPDAPGINGLLNYGYAILRASVARAIVGAGLHPSLGIHHHNQYNGFCLADDLMEPLRPLADIKVYELCQMPPEEPDVTVESRRALLEILRWDCRLGGQKLPLMVALHHYAASVRKVICGEAKQAEVPAL